MDNFYKRGSLFVLLAIMLFFLMQHKAKAQIINLTLPVTDFFKSNSDRRAFIPGVSFIGAYTAMKMMYHSDSEEKKKREATKEMERLKNEKGASSYDNTASCSFHVKNAGAQKDEILPLKMLIKNYQQECTDKYLREHIYLKDFLGYYFSSRDNANGFDTEIYLKFSIDHDHVLEISEQDLEDQDTQRSHNIMLICFFGFLILFVVAFIIYLERSSR